MYVCTKSFLKTTTNSLCVCTHLANKADSDSDSDLVFIILGSQMENQINHSPKVQEFYPVEKGSKWLL